MSDIKDNVDNVANFVILSLQPFEIPSDKRQ
jgi:hypothetical protein